MQGERPTSAVAGPARWVAVGAVGASAIAGTAWTLASRTPRDVRELPAQAIVLPPDRVEPRPAPPAAPAAPLSVLSPATAPLASVEPATPSAASSFSSDPATPPLPMIVSRSRIGPPIPELLPASSATDPGTLAKPADASASPVTITWRSPANAIAPPEPAAKPAPALAPASTPTRKINVNRAPAAELELLPDVGPALAARILDHRAKHGAFKSLEDLDAVSGIGPKTLEKLKDRIVFADPAPVPAPAPR